MRAQDDARQAVDWYQWCSSHISLVAYRLKWRGSLGIVSELKPYMTFSLSKCQTRMTVIF
ncbi:hypothetical protein YC2023_075276 [Brassica napus]